MEMQFKMPFEMQRLMCVTELGSVGYTYWTGILTHNNGKCKLVISRDEVDCKGDFNVELYDEKEVNVFSKDGSFLPGVSERKISLPRSIACLNGYLTVFYTLNFSLADDLLHLLDSPDSFSDATLVCGSTKILVHRHILCARSPVFAAMFKTQMQEGREGVVDIVDMEPDILRAMLRYVYSGKTDHVNPLIAEDLLFGADKYQLKELKSICVEELKASMAANVFRRLVLGDLHDKSLKACAMNFIICNYRNFSDLEKTEEWQSLTKVRPSLAMEVTTTVIKYLQNT